MWWGVHFIFLQSVLSETPQWGPLTLVLQYLPCSSVLPSAPKIQITYTAFWIIPGSCQTTHMIYCQCHLSYSDDKDKDKCLKYPTYMLYFRKAGGSNMTFWPDQINLADLTCVIAARWGCLSLLQSSDCRFKDDWCFWRWWGQLPWTSTLGRHMDSLMDKSRLNELENELYNARNICEHSSYVRKNGAVPCAVKVV